MKKKELLETLFKFADKARVSMERCEAAKDWFGRGQYYARWTTLNQVIRMLTDEEYANQIANEVNEDDGL